MDSQRVWRDADIVATEVALPEGHHHLRTVLPFRGGEENVLQETTVANLLRAFVAVKSHPRRTPCRLAGRNLDPSERKVGFASWQPLEEASSCASVEHFGERSSGTVITHLWAPDFGLRKIVRSA